MLMLADCNETETIGHVLGFCRKSELLRNNRHNRVRTSTAEVLRHLGWEVHEEVHYIPAADSKRRADIIAIDRVKDKAMVLDPAIRFERNLSQADEVNNEKQEIYQPCLPFLSSKYNIPVNQWVVKGDNAGEMSPGSSTESYPAFARIGLRENPRNLSRPGIEPGPPGFAARRANRYSTGVDTRLRGFGPDIISLLLGVGRRANNPSPKKQLVMKPNNKPRNGTDSPARPQQMNKVIRFGTWNVTSLYRTGGVTLVAKELKVRTYKTIILLVILYGCETWTLTLREEQRLRVFENKVLRKIFGAKRDEVIGEWRKLHNAELHALYSSPDIIRNIKSRRLRWAGHVARMGESRNAYRVLVGRPAGKRPLERPRRRWEDNIKMDLREVGYDD
ncbi:hypothetical protein ANN_22320 [Periplaneta americana]|uniref:Endonuclease-reverse transcriptase n=1 Tax=Periplaneta americana TaxID=6978 RepID=A0ABQ8S8R9_PERAM|nr:hypothetical protein ANN_22320 [Periplaneta americana]